MLLLQTEGHLTTVSLCKKTKSSSVDPRKAGSCKRALKGRSSELGCQCEGGEEVM